MPRRPAPPSAWIPRSLAAAIAASCLLLVASPALADLTWQPEGRIFVRYGFPVQGQLQGSDSSFDLVDARFGARVSILPDLSVRGVGEVLDTQDSRYPPVLRWGYLEYALPGIATVQAGQVPMPFVEEEDRVVGDPLIGSGIAQSSGFLSPGGLGAALRRDAAIGAGTASAEVAALYTDGWLGNNEMTPNAIQPAYAGPGPSLAGHLGYTGPSGWSAHVFGRWGWLQDQQAGLAGDWDGSGWHLAAEAVASESNPAYTLATGEVVRDAAAYDAATLLSARYDLGTVLRDLWKVSLLARLGAVFGNVTDTRRSAISVYPVASPGQDYTGDLALIYSINDYSQVAIDAQLLRQVLGSATQSISVGVRLGVHF